MALDLPEPLPGVLGRRDRLVRRLRGVVGKRSVIDDAASLRAFDCDALTIHRQVPMVAVIPETREEVCAVLRLCCEEGVRVVPRGSGTSLSGGALPLADAVLLVMSRFDRILEIDPEERLAVVEPGIANLAVSDAVAPFGLFYAPDPSSQVACSIGGNLAENAGGVHCLKYGLTTHNVAGLEIALMTGEVVRLGGRSLEAAGYDLRGLAIGSEGLLGVVLEATLRLRPQPETVAAALIAFASVGAAADTTAAIIAAGVIPAGVEMMDRAAVAAAEAFVAAGYPLDAEAILIVEVDGSAAECAAELARIETLARACGARRVQIARDMEERNRFWLGRKAAFPAVGRLAPDYLCMDGVIPRRRLAEALEGISGLAARHGLQVANVFHAGDGNLHPLILFDARRDGELEAAERLGADILRLCVALGGVLTGEHGVGVEKRDLMEVMFTQTDLDQQIRVKTAFDAGGLLNPGKVFPRLHRCAEGGRLRVSGGRIPHPELPRF